MITCTKDLQSTDTLGLAKILVYGFYGNGKNNLGDNLFIEAFQYLFPNHIFTFTDHITLEMLKEPSAVFIGGGSLLDGKPEITLTALDKLKTMPIFYMGVGAETNIHPIHLDLMKLAKLICIRNENQIDKIKAINPSTIYAPDLVYCLQNKVDLITKKPNTVLIMPNFYTVPQWDDANWKHAAWNYFKSEFAQFLDEIIEDGYKVDFFPMCQDEVDSDAATATEIINHMKNRKCKIFSYNPNCEINTVCRLIKTYSLIITQRYHGIVLSEMMQTPYIVLHHHDKLKSSKENYLSYYGVYKKELLDTFYKEIVKTPEAVILSDYFTQLKDQVSQFL